MMFWFRPLTTCKISLMALVQLSPPSQLELTEVESNFRIWTTQIFKNVFIVNIIYFSFLHPQLIPLYHNIMNAVFSLPPSSLTAVPSHAHSLALSLVFCFFLTDHSFLTLIRVLSFLFKMDSGHQFQCVRVYACVFRGSPHHQAIL